MDNGKWKMENGKGEDGVEETGGKGVRGREGAEKALLSVLSKKEKGTTGPTVEVCGVRENRGRGRRGQTRTRRSKRQEDGSSQAARKRVPHRLKAPVYIYIYQHTINHVRSRSLSTSLFLFPSFLEVRKKTYLVLSLYAKCRMWRYT